MWNYDKLFAEGNVVGIKNNKTNKTYIDVIETKEDKEFYIEDYGINTLDYSPSNEQIQYIIRLDEHGNVVEKLFDRKRDMKPKPEPMPELETGMFVRVNTYDGSHIGFVDAENNHVIYQEGGYDFIDDDDINGYGIASKIVEVYSKDTCAFDFCTEDDLIWRKPESN